RCPPVLAALGPGPASPFRARTSLVVPPPSSGPVGWGPTTSRSAFAAPLATLLLPAVILSVLLDRRRLLRPGGQKQMLQIKLVFRCGTHSNVHGAKPVTLHVSRSLEHGTVRTELQARSEERRVGKDGRLQ